MAVKTTWHVDPFDTPAQRTRAGVFGMWVFIVVVAMLFGACILGYLVVRLEPEPSAPWMPPGTPGLPHTLLLSTGILLLSSWTMQQSVVAARRGAQALAHTALVWTLALAVAFLVVQCIAWVQLWRQDAEIDSTLYAWTFYVLTGVHALHVLGGLPPLVVATVRSARGRYTAAEHSGLVYCAMYWHTLDVIWLALYATLWLGSR
jgi:cytochrome c oxidase subunit III